MPARLRFFNTLTRRQEEFLPLREGHVGLYTCGPTVYNYVHIGNLRTFVCEDVLRRTLKAFGYQVTQVQNLTDIDDKTIRGAAAEGVSLRDFTDRYAEAFFSDIKNLSLPIKIFVWAIPFSHPFLTTQNLLLENYKPIFGGIVYMLAFFIFLIILAARIFSTDRVLTMKLRFRRKKIVL